MHYIPIMHRNMKSLINLKWMVGWSLSGIPINDMRRMAWRGYWSEKLLDELGYLHHKNFWSDKIVVVDRRLDHWLVPLQGSVQLIWVVPNGLCIPFVKRWGPVIVRKNDSLSIYICIYMYMRDMVRFLEDTDEPSSYIWFFSHPPYGDLLVCFFFCFFFNWSFILVVTNGLNLFKAYFQYFREVDDSVEQ